MAFNADHPDIAATTPTAYATLAWRELR